MKIALVCDWYEPRVGGIEIQLAQLAARLRRAGHEVQVITATPGDATAGVERMRAPLLPAVGVLYTPAGFRELDRALAAGGFDVVHTHVSIVSPTAVGAAYIANRRGIPLVVTFHSWIPAMRALTRVIGGALGSPRWNAVFTAVSRRVAREVAPAAGRHPIEILSNGIDAPSWNQAGQTPLISDQGGLTRLIGGRVEFVSVMRLNPKKRPATLVRLMSDVQRAVPASASVRLRIVGDGPERRRVERAIIRRRLSHCVELTGRLSHDEIRELYSRSHAFVLPTIRESFGMAAAEARAAGLPVIARADSGVGDWLAHEREGLLAADDTGIARAMIRLATDSDLRDRIAAHNRSTSPDCDWAPVLGRHLEIYARAIALRRSVSA